MRSNNKYYTLLACLGLMLKTTTSYANPAQTPDPFFQSQKQMIDKYSQDEEIEKMGKEIENEKRMQAEDREIKENLSKEQNQIKSETSFYISKITIIDTKALSKSDISNITSKYVNKSLTFSDILNLKSEIELLYTEKGYITTQVYLPEQNIKETGELKIIVKEGKISEVKLLQNGNEYKYHSKLLTAMPLTYIKQVFGFKTDLNLKDLEHGIEVINSLESNSAKIKIMASDNGILDNDGNINDDKNSVGNSKVLITNTPKRKALFNNNPDRFELGDRTKISLGVENSGLDQVGRWRKVLTISQDDLLGLNDNFSLFHSSNLQNYNGRNSNATSLNYSIPLGRLKFTYGHVKSDYLSTVDGLNRNFSLSGKTYINSYKADYQAILTKNNKTTIYSKLNSWNVNNYLEDAKIDVSSRRSTTMELGFSSLFKFNTGYFYINASQIRGMRINGSKEDGNIIDTSPHNQFEKYKSNIVLSKNFNLGSQIFTFESRATGQYSKNTLYAQEQLFMGDRYSVRGFQDQYLIGDTGGFVQNEIIYNVPNFAPFKTISQFINNMKLFAAYDFGYIKPRFHDNITQGQNHGRLAGATIGTRWNARFSSFDLAVSKPIDHPSAMQNVSSLFVYFGMRVGLV